MDRLRMFVGIWLFLAARQLAASLE